MAFLAFFAEITAVGIIQLMTGNALGCDIFVLFVSMATTAGDFLVCMLEREVCLIMIKTGVLPAFFVVTVGALFTEFAIMGVIFLMAVKAQLWRFPVFFF